MRLLSLLYYHGSRLKLPWSKRTHERFRTAGQFDMLYALDRDPFAVSTSDYEAKKTQALLSLIGDIPLGNVLDVGCGTGELARALSDRATNIEGIDFSNQAIQLANAKSNPPNVRFYCQSIVDLECEEKFGHIICSEVLYYLSEQELTAALSHIRSCAALNATLFVTARADDDLLWKRLRDALRVVSFETFPDSHRPFSIGRYALDEES